LKQIWDWILLKKEMLTVEEIIERFQQFPMVVVTKEEDNRLREHHAKNPRARYEAAKIEVLRLQDGKWIPETMTIPKSSIAQLDLT
jgi:hypothetical protein